MHLTIGGARGGVLGRDGVGRQLQGRYHPHRPHGNEEVTPSTLNPVPQTSNPMPHGNKEVSPPVFLLHT